MTDVPTTASSPTRPNLWRNRNWRLYWTGETVSVAGDYVFDVTVLLWVVRVIALHVTWAPAAASGVLVAAGAPALVVGPFAGVFVDRWDRRRTMLTADAARAVLVAALIPLSFASVSAHLTRAAQLGIVYAVVAAASCFSQFFGPSKFAMLGVIVPEADVPKASGLLMSATYTASIVGPPLAAPLLFTAGVRWALIINSVSFAVSFVTIWLIHLGPAHQPAAESLAAGSPEPAPQPQPAGQSGGFWREFVAGLRFFAASPVLVAVVVGLSVTAAGAAAINVVNVFFLQVNLHSSASLYGTFGMAEGVGGVLGTLLAAWVIARLHAGKAFCAGLILAGVALIGYSRSSELVAALALLAATGTMLGVVNTAISPLLLGATPQHMIGRVTSVITPVAYLAVIGATAAAGALTSTVMRGFQLTVAGIHLGPYDTVIGVGGLLFAVAGLAALPILVVRQPQGQLSDPVPAPDAAAQPGQAEL